MNGTICMEKLHIWYSPTVFLESPSRAESNFTGIKPKGGTKYGKSLQFFHSRNMHDYTFEWENTGRILHMNNTYCVYLEKTTKHRERTVQSQSPFIREHFARAVLLNCLGNFSFCYERPSRKIIELCLPMWVVSHQIGLIQ